MLLMKVYMNTGGLVATNGYLVVDETTGLAAVVDAPHNTISPLLTIARHNNWKIIYLLLTHGHWDHIGDHQLVTDEHREARVLIHSLDEPKLIRPISIFMPLPIEYRREKRMDIWRTGRLFRSATCNSRFSIPQVIHPDMSCFIIRLKIFYLPATLYSLVRSAEPICLTLIPRQ